MIRTIFIPATQHIPLNIPAQYVGKRVEVIAFPLDDPFADDVITTHLASEQTLSKDWLTPEEDRAWNDL
ncbi:MAG: hypothetical protein LBF69_05035 [Prevotellaceae bacterium]|jgi:hypothetical protein|nr:hypothetical protein [Prevotellaceae bacterium]